MKKTQKNIYILGISAFYHDSSACLIKNGEILSAASEERFTRKKQDENFPEKAVKFCLEKENINISNIDYVVFYEKPILKFERLLQTYIQNWPWGLRSFLKAMKTWLSQKLWIDSEIKKELNWKGKVHYIPHHISHGASSFYTSGFEKSVVLTIDGVGEWSTTTLGLGKKNDLKIDKEIIFPHSLGLFYSSFTYFLGFKVNSGEYKVMGLAPYGKPKYKKEVLKLINIKDDGSFELNRKYFCYEYDLKMTGQAFEKLFGVKTRKKDDDLQQIHKDIAASLQEVIEEILLKMADFAYKTYKTENLCLSGGVALNCVANGRILRESKFKNIYIFPASGDAGGSVGASLYLYHHILKKGKPQKLKTIYLGPEYKKSEILEFLEKHKINYISSKNPEEIPDLIAQKLEQNKIIGHFAGRMEFGPRALGNRSILADPRQEENWKKVNLKIKFRESFRPFAPSVLAEKAQDIFELDSNLSPYMLLTTKTKVSNLPAITHVNKSARVQTVSEIQNKKYYQILKSFEKLTNCPVLINTSFNVRGEPIVCDYIDAFKCYIRTHMDVLVLEDFIIELDQKEKDAYKKVFHLEDFEED